MIDFIGMAPDENDMKAADLPPGLITPPVLSGPGELEAAERAYRECDAGGCNRVIFDEGDDEDPEKVVFGNAADWQKWMGAPRLPTIEEAQAYQAWAVAVMNAEMFEAIEAARRQAASPVRPPPPTLTETPDDPEPPRRPSRGPTADGYKLA